MASAVSSQVEKSLCALGSKGSLYTGVSVLLYGLCVYMDIGVHLSIAVFSNKWNWVGISVHHDGRSSCCSNIQTFSSAWSYISEVPIPLLLGYFITVNRSPPSKRIGKSVWETEMLVDIL